MSNTITLSAMATIFRVRGIEPDQDFTAASGSDYGQVNAWELPDGDYLVEYGNNGQTDYAIADDADDLACWLESPDLDGLDTLLQTANVRGAEEVDEADEDAKGPLYVLVTRYWYGATETSRWAMDDDERDPLEFATHAEAQAWIDDAEDGIYTLSHNESGAPSYKIVTL